MWLLLLPVAQAARPTSGSGLWAFDSSDVIEQYDSEGGRVRVTWSSSGPNEAASRDTDGDGIPDIVEDTAEIAEEALVLFEELGFRPPVPEADFGVEHLGGSPAFDFYLVDFGGGADGTFQVDACSQVPAHCAGHMIVENDFAGSGYSSVRQGLEVVVPHELFHGVQAAYEAELPVWMSEGTATWAELQWDPASSDYMRLADGYLDDTQRPIFQAPTGPASAWSYGTALWFDHVGTVQEDALWVEELLTDMERPSADPLDEVEVMLALFDARGWEIAPLWQSFSQWNLATDSRSGALEGYGYAKRIGPIEAEGEGEMVDDDHRFQPLATTYWRVDHAGGELAFAIEASTPELVFGLHSVADGAEDGPVDEALMTWRGDSQSLGELPAGGYWLWGAQDALNDGSIKVRVCLGTPDQIADCELADTGDTGDTGISEDPGGCGGCAGGGGLGGLWVLALGGVLLRRRR